MEGTQKYEGCDGTTSPHSQPSVDSMLLTPTSAASHSPSESRCYTVLSSLQAAFAFVVFSKICHVHRSRVTEMKQRKEGSQPSGVQPPLTRTTTAFFSWMHPCCSNVLANSINREHYCMYSRAVCFRVLCPVLSTGLDFCWYWYWYLPTSWCWYFCGYLILEFLLVLAPVALFVKYPPVPVLGPLSLPFPHSCTNTSLNTHTCRVLTYLYTSASTDW